MPTGAQKIAETLIDAGVDHVFGIPGGATVAIYNSLFDKQDKMKVILARHEQSSDRTKKEQPPSFVAEKQATNRTTDS